MQPNRKIIVAGNANGGEMMTVTRLKPDGSLDTTFVGNGTTTIDFGSLAELANGAELQPDGKIVIAGQQAGADDFAMARLLGRLSCPRRGDRRACRTRTCGSWRDGP